jgi:endonuclease III
MSTSKISQIDKVFEVFEKHYVLVPLEIFAADPYKTLISTLMSARTKDEVTLERSLKLFKLAPGFTELKRLTESEISSTIYPVGFYKTKAKHIVQLVNIMLEKYNCVVPRSRQELMSLPGVGRKTANLVLNRAFGIPAIAVDIHVHRISNLLGWVNTNSPEKTDIALHKFLPVRYWARANKLFVSIGRQHTTTKSLISFLVENKLISSDSNSK